MVTSHIKFLAAAAATIGVLAVGSTVSASADPVDPGFEVTLVESTFDYSVCPMVDEVVSLLAPFIGDHDMALDMVVAWAVEEYEVGYGQNLTESGEAALVDLMEGCTGGSYGFTSAGPIDDCLGKSCEAAAPEEIPFDIEADNDVATVWELAPGICETARELDGDGLTGQEISDAAVDVFMEEGLISTPEGAMYLRGMVRGCLAG